ncbi:MAG: GNAT family N-acetyltransferase [Gemmatimonadota bacterium]|nr:GNAT family N-acetyltransferase [Gemmatimonadota bacterium]
MKRIERRIERFAPGDVRSAAWESLQGRVSAASAMEVQAAGMYCMTAWVGEEPVARLGLGAARDLRDAPGISGVIGYYAATDEAAGAALLRHAACELAAEGAVRVLGPMNGSSWANYRQTLPADDRETEEPPFLSEPGSPPEDVEHFLAAGFRIRALYASSISRGLARAHPVANRIARGLAKRGVTVRPLDTGDLEAEMRAIHSLSLRAFAHNPYFTPIEWNAFHAMYRPLLPLLDPALVRMAHDTEGRLVGFVFAFPDPLGLPERRVVLKTLATAPEARGLGLGSWLTDEVRRIAHEAGYAAVIHALMHVDNDSRRISAHTAEPFRRYALFGWEP